MASFFFIFIISFIGCAYTVNVCPDGRYGPDCSLICGPQCEALKCIAEVELGAFNCSSGCAAGWTGPACNRKCPRRCISCDQRSGSCSKCQNGWCGDTCAEMCGGSGGGSGRCIDASCLYCEEGWYGADCAKRCPVHCDSGCHKTSGTCDHQCVTGYHGSTCSMPCTTTCRHGCQQNTRECLDGCQTGWHGPFCNMSCNTNCKHDVCFQSSGACSLGVVPSVSKRAKCKRVWSQGGFSADCSKGCEHGWRGARCDQMCPQKCYSCPQYPDDRLCIYGREVTDTQTRGLPDPRVDSIGLRVGYTCVLVLFPFVIVCGVQLIRIGWDKVKPGKKKDYEFCIDTEKRV